MSESLTALIQWIIFVIIIIAWESLNKPNGMRFELWQKVNN